MGRYLFAPNLIADSSLLINETDVKLTIHLFLICVGRNLENGRIFQGFDIGSCSLLKRLASGLLHCQDLTGNETSAQISSCVAFHSLSGIISSVQESWQYSSVLCRQIKTIGKYLQLLSRFKVSKINLEWQ